MKKFEIVMLLTAAVSIASSVSSSMAFANTNSDAQAVWDFVHSANQTIVHTADRCLALYGPDAGTSEYTLRENHDAFCSGDPQISNAVGFFKIDKSADGKTTLVSQLEIVSDTYQVVFSEPRAK